MTKKFAVKVTVEKTVWYRGLNGIVNNINDVQGVELHIAKKWMEMLNLSNTMNGVEAKNEIVEVAK